LKGEERVCHVTEADRLGAAKAVRLSEEVSSCEAALRMGPRLCGDSAPADAGSGGFAPVRGGVTASSCDESSCDEDAGIKRKEGHLVDALALRGDEGRGTLRKARGRCERSVIPGCPNGATHPVTGILG
jgi:hypothetical protein